MEVLLSPLTTREAVLSSRIEGTQATFFLTAIMNQAQENLDAARKIIELYERLKVKVIGLTNSRYAVPLLDHLFERPIFATTDLEGHSELPSKQMTMGL